MLNFAVCDDNIVILNRLVKMLEGIFIENNLDAQISFSSSSANELLNYTSNNNLDVLILDINFKSEYSGLELAKKIRQQNRNLYLIFFTAHLEYALVAYKLKTFDYLPKPVTPERLEETVLRIFEDIKAGNSKTNFIKLGNSKVLLKEDDVQFIQKDGMKLIYHTLDRTYETYSSLSKIQNHLPSNFVRCHKSYIVNVNNITNIKSNDTVIFNSERYCSIGPKYKNNLMEVFNNGNFAKCLDSINN